MATPTKNSARRRRFAAALCAFLVVGLAAGLYWFQPWRLWTTTVVDDALPALAADVSLQVATGPATAGSVTALSMSTSMASVPPLTTAPSTTAPSTTAPPPSTAPSSATRATRSTAVAAPPRRPSTVALPTSAITSPTPTTAPASTVTPAAATVLATGMLITHEHQTSGTVRIVRLADGSRVLTLEDLRTSGGPALHVWLTDAPVIHGEDGWKVFDDGRYADLGDLKGNVGNQVYPLPPDLDLALYTSVSIWCERFSVSFGAASFVG